MHVLNDMFLCHNALFWMCIVDHQIQNYMVTQLLFVYAAIVLKHHKMRLVKNI